MKNLPNKWIRKAIYDAINNMVVDGVTVPCYDTRVYGNVNPDVYVLITSQTNTEDKATKCGSRWESTLVLDVFTRYSGTSNPGSNLLSDNIADEIMSRTSAILLDEESNLQIITLNFSEVSNITSITKNENIFRKLIRYELTID